jgi:uncharacterized protein
MLMEIRVRPVEDLPLDIEVIEHTWIPMRDGTRLAARIWLPVGAEERPVPAILEYIPYRKRDNTRARDARQHPYFAAHGYAAVRVDLRGSGDSEGVLTDEYLPLELQDGEDVLAWIADQEWCDGNVGMMGISWGGFNGLQLAARRPAPLKAVIAVSATDNRYTDDVHYMGGCLLSDNLSWASQMFAYNSLPPDPEIVGTAWRDWWFQRLKGSGLWLERWLSHQHYDSYWRHGSISEDYGAIAAPVMIVSGWADGYSNAVFRALANLEVPCRGIVGPWSHLYPNLASPGPAIGFLQEALRWWDRWLKGVDNGIDDEPALWVWMQHTVEPTAAYAERPGHWVAEPAWPSSSMRLLRHLLSRGRILAPGALPSDEPEARSISSPLSVGMFGGKWCSYGAGPDHPHDQRAEDGGSLVFDSEPLEQPLELLGAPEVVLELESSNPVAMVAVRLSDIARDDKATRVSYGLLNLCHRDGHDDPKPVVPGERMRVRLRLNHCAQRFPVGHRLRLSLSTSYWPLAWPPPEPVQLHVYPENSSLFLPVWQQRPGDEPPREFESSEAAPPIQTTVLEAPTHNWVFKRDLGSDRTILEVTDDHGVRRIEEIDLQLGRRNVEEYRHQGEDVTTATGETVVVRSLARDGWSVETVGRTELSCTPTHFLLHATLDAYENGKRVHSRIWDRQIPRDLL